MFIYNFFICLFIFLKATEIVGAFFRKYNRFRILILFSHWSKYKFWKSWLFFFFQIWEFVGYRETETVFLGYSFGKMSWTFCCASNFVWGESKFCQKNFSLFYWKIFRIRLFIRSNGLTSFSLGDITNFKWLISSHDVCIK